MDTLGIDVTDPEKSKNEIFVRNFHNRRSYILNLLIFKQVSFLKTYCEVFNNSQFNQELMRKIETVKQEPFNAPSNHSL